MTTRRPTWPVLLIALLAYQLSHSECRLMIMSAGFLKRDYAALIEDARAEDYDLSGLEQIFCLSDGPPPEGMEAFEELWRIGVDVPYEPMEYKTPDGELTGFDIDCNQRL